MAMNGGNTGRGKGTSAFSLPMTGKPEIDPERAPAGAVLMEVSWEVCNQLGGIYQVIRSKAPTMMRRWRNRYFLVGPYVPEKAAVEFEEKRPGPGTWMARVLDALAAQGLTVHHGRWLVPGRPKALLLEHGSSTGGRGVDEIKFALWEQHGIEFGWGSDWLVNGVVTFGDAVARLMRAVSEQWVNGGKPLPEWNPRPERRVIAHCHEWMGGLAIPRMRRELLPVASVFTTHATQLGRTIAWNDEYFYDHLPFVDAGADAARMNVQTQHGVEKACAHASHVFTTVSPITGEECEHLLGRRPDMVLPNGLNIEHFNVGHEFQTMHALYKERINRFVMGHFFPSYSFDLDNTLYFFTSGRFEPRNKGFDVCIEAMARLNAELRAGGLNKSVVLFIVTQRPTRSLNPAVLHRRGVLNELDEVCRKITTDLGEQLFRRAASRQAIRLDDMVGEYWSLRFRRTQHAFRSDQLPPVVTHIMEDEANDEVLNKIRQVWLFNRPDDPVKIVYHPEFISPTNPLWGLEYEQFVRGCHMGIFPSAYEPWGYTPLECLAMGVPAITSDLAGFGRYVEDVLPELAGLGPRRREVDAAGGAQVGGITILRRRGRTFGEAAGDLAKILLEFCKLDRRGRINLRNEVERRSWEFDWTKLGQAYDWAHDLAMARAGTG